jgi:hypothetical protein
MHDDVPGNMFKVVLLISQGKHDATSLLFHGKRGSAMCCGAKFKRDGMVRPVPILAADGHTVSNAPDLRRPPMAVGDQEEKSCLSSNA